MNKEPIPTDAQIVGLVFAVFLTAMFVEDGGTMERGFWYFLLSLPVAAVGILIYKFLIKHEFTKPKSWPEWIFVYVIGLLIGGPIFILVKVLYRNFQ